MIRSVIEEEVQAEMDEVIGKTVRRAIIDQGGITGDQEAMNVEAANIPIIIDHTREAEEEASHPNLHPLLHQAHLVLHLLQVAEADLTLRIVSIIVDITKVGKILTKSKTNLQLQTFTHIFRRIRSMALKSQQLHKSFGMASNGL